MEIVVVWFSQSLRAAALAFFFSVAITIYPLLFFFVWLNAIK